MASSDTANAIMLLLSPHLPCKVEIKWPHGHKSDSDDVWKVGADYKNRKFLITGFGEREFLVKDIEKLESWPGNLKFIWNVDSYKIEVVFSWLV